MKPVRFCGRDFSSTDLDRIRTIIAADDCPNRAEISRRTCRALNWIRPDGRLKDMSCRVALLRMHQRDLITLPPPEKGNGNSHRGKTITSRSDPEFPITAKAGQLKLLHLHVVATKEESSLWNEYIQRYHYLGYQTLPGAQIRYFIRTDQQILGALGFGAAAWKTLPRDHWIGWHHDMRTKKLHLIVNNARFLILPWVKSPNLASKVLAMAVNRLPDDWQNIYGYRPVLMETFVEKKRFRGTCYKAANWIYLGDTTGRGKLDSRHKHRLPIKAIFVYPLVPDFRQRLNE